MVPEKVDYAQKTGQGIPRKKSRCFVPDHVDRAWTYLSSGSCCKGSLTNRENCSVPNPVKTGIVNDSPMLHVKCMGTGNSGHSQLTHIPLPQKFSSSLAMSVPFPELPNWEFAFQEACRNSFSSFPFRIFQGTCSSSFSNGNSWLPTSSHWLRASNPFPLPVPSLGTEA